MVPSKPQKPLLAGRPCPTHVILGWFRPALLSRGWLCLLLFLKGTCGNIWGDLGCHHIKGQLLASGVEVRDTTRLTPSLARQQCFSAALLKPRVVAAATSWVLAVCGRGVSCCPWVTASGFSRCQSW